MVNVYVVMGKNQGWFSSVPYSQSKSSKLICKPIAFRLSLLGSDNSLIGTYFLLVDDTSICQGDVTRSHHSSKNLVTTLYDRAYGPPFHFIFIFVLRLSSVWDRNVWIKQTILFLDSVCDWKYEIEKSTILDHKKHHQSL